MERNEGRRDEVDTAADNDGDDEDWIEVAEELLAQTPIDGSGKLLFQSTRAALVYFS